MSRLRLVLCAVLLTPSVGCTSIREWLGRNQTPANTGAVPKVTAEQLVGYLNAHADRLQSLTYGSVGVSGRDGLMEFNLNGHMAASQPRNFRMVVTRGGLINSKVDVGSNEQLFWASAVDVPTVPPMYVFASHADFEQGKARLPGNVPFEPDWVLQALGMKRYPLNAAYEEVTVPDGPATPAGRAPLPPAPRKSVPINEKDRTYTLRWPTTTPGGAEVFKEIVFAADDADAARNQPQVKRHLIRDARGKVLALAEVKSAHTVPVGGTDPVTKRPYVIQYPTEIELKSDDQKFKLVLRLDAAKVNQPVSPQDAGRLFDLPNIAGLRPTDLAHARFDSPNK